MDENPVRVLLIDDDEDTYVIIRAHAADMSSRGFRLEWVSSYEAGRAAMLARSFDVYLLDYRLGAYDGLALLREAVASGCREPIIMLTGQGKEELDVLAMKSGAADYLVKGEFDANRLERSIRYALERTRLLEARDYERHLLHTLMDSIPDGIYFKDRQGRYVRVNRARAERCGWEHPDEAIGKTDSDIFSEEYAKRTHAEEQSVIVSGEPVVGKEEQLTWPCGETSWVSTTKVPFRNEQRAIIGTIGVSREISNLKRTQEDLRAARDTAEAANRAKSDFLANVSHEMRTPLHAMLGMTDLVLDGKLTEPQRDSLNIVRESGLTLRAVIDDILDFSNIESGRLRLEVAEFHLREVVGDVMKIMNTGANRRGLKMACRIAPQIPERLTGDAQRLRQVLINLVGNALKFTERGEVVVDVACPSGEERHALLEVAVSDTGVGIPREKLEAIFQAFEQADGSATRRFGGTGLGLAISSQLVRLMGGDMSLQSEVGRGSTFRFTIRCGVPAGSVAGVPLRQITDLPGTRTLVVDDHDASLRIMEEILSSWGLEATSCSNAEDALDVLREAHAEDRAIPLLLSDVNMPNVDGFKLVEQIRREPTLADMRVILLTSGARAADDDRCKQLGVAAQLLKPVKQSELFDALVATLGIEAREAKQTRDLPRRTERPLNVLLAEDSLFNQKLAVGLLEKWGHAVTVAHDGQEAVEAIEKTTFDLVLMDVQMPRMDGIKATQRIRQWEQEAGSHILIIAMTAHAMEGDRQRCLDAGMDRYIAKPVDASEFWNTLEDVGRSLTSATPKAGVSDQRINWAAALKIVDGRHDLLEELVEIFCHEYPQLLQDVLSAIEGNDAESVTLRAHRMKGCLRFFGENRAGDLACELESLGREERLDQAAGKYEELVAEIEELVPELRKFSS